ncbi:flap endonuclease [Pectobacterium phage DU_PP_V]|uniref:Flap endonuclease n=1 Tax=Pectobacterium phage DU_PP_V TaxID=2041492 RepID=A0A2D2W718_9CAUD|nr:flap endonuclease [Pectobacterium phage DU_PP_V]ATS94088.1 flap endonuclease [Pectobacterium phage DU_PP_V]
MAQEAEAEIKSRRNLVIVDGTNLAFRFNGNKGESFSTSYIKTINSFGKSYNARHIIVLGDKGKSIFRTEIDPGYKANRDAKYENQTEAERAEAKAFFECVDEAFELCATTLPTLRIRGVEADDLAAYIKAQIGHLYDHIWLISTDGDWDILLDENTSRFSFQTRKEYRIENMFDYHGVDTVDQFVSLKAIMGDTGDNVIGVEGIGVKRGYNLIKEYGSALDIVDQLPLPGKQKFIQSLNASGDLITRNLMLVDLKSFCGEALAAAGDTAINAVSELLAGLEKEILNGE